MRRIALRKQKTEAGRCPLNRLQKFGFLALVFFTIKGMLWLIIPALIASSL
ncbi:MAG: hypothetical protein H6813_01680 [Phycisphaeraceae bacterium]|nr:hypothetical protein [Phycisphaeraceae bacterium]